MSSIKIDVSDAKIDSMIKEANTSNTGSVSKEEFIAMMSRRVKGADSEADIVNAFKILADDLQMSSKLPSNFFQMFS